MKRMIIWLGGLCLVLVSGNMVAALPWQKNAFLGAAATVTLAVAIAAIRVHIRRREIRRFEALALQEPFVTLSHVKFVTQERQETGEEAKILQGPWQQSA